MRRRKRQEPPGSARRVFQHQPFRELATKAAVPRRAAKLEPAQSRPALESPPDVNDDEAFAREMAGVTPLPAAERGRIPHPPPAAGRPIADPDIEVIEALTKLVDGSGSFDIADTTEYLEGAVAGLDRRLVRRLRSGDFAFQSHVDLHGLTADEARGAVDRFLATALQRGDRCVLIVHGRGRNSKDQVPVLKRRLTGWLSRSTWARYVLAFTSARPCDGGVGALYVLLRRRRSAKRPIHVTEGAKW
jgi:DNA-nicking Smr family endonuclease